jgi:hypothetical protein
VVGAVSVWVSVVVCVWVSVLSGVVCSRLLRSRSPLNSVVRRSLPPADPPASSSPVVRIRIPITKASAAVPKTTL